MGVIDDAIAGYGVSQMTRAQLNRLELSLAELGIRYSEQQERQIGRLHTFRSAERAELDYSKHRILLYPNRAWNTPLTFQTGLVVDHHSTAIKGIDLTVQPTTASSIRLYRNAVLPKRLWLPAPLAAKYADEWDVVGIDRMVALDNDRALQSDGFTLMFIGLGIIPLRIPPERGDLKGTVERTHLSLEEIFFQTLPGFIPGKYQITDPRAKHLIKKARAEARLTVAEFLEFLVLAILEYNRMDHPRFKRPRIQVYRDGLEHAPVVLLTGRRQIDTTFALSYTRPIAREGVQVESWHYNSPELGEWRTTGRSEVLVRVNPDDVRTALAFRRMDETPIELQMTTFRFPEPTSFEMAKTILFRQHGQQQSVCEDGLDPELAERYWKHYYDVVAGTGPVEGATPHHAAQAAAQAASAGPSQAPEPPRAEPMSDEEIRRRFGDLS